MNMNEINDGFEGDEEDNIGPPPPGSQLPIAAVFRPEIKLFRVVRCWKRDLGLGGFGVSITEAQNQEEETNDHNIDYLEAELENMTDEAVHRESSDEIRNAANNEKSDNDAAVTESEGTGTSRKASKISAQHLFLEEVIFLHERGVIDAMDENEQILDSYRLYNDMMSRCCLTLACYLVYAHLRAQTFRVLRHSPVRRSVLEEIDKTLQRLPLAEQKLALKKNSRLLRLKNQLREAASTAPIPQLVTSRRQFSTSTTTVDDWIAYDVYNPNAKFSRSYPGLPDFYVAASFYAADESLSFMDIAQLLQWSDPIPVKLALVSDAGTVIMLGVTDFGVPVIRAEASEQGKGAEVR